MRLNQDRMHGDQSTVCNFTHAYILVGTCPTCGSVVMNGECSPAVMQKECPELRWNVDVMLKALDSEDTEGRSRVLRALLVHANRLQDILPVLHKALADPKKEIQNLACLALTELGSRLSPEEAKGFEEAVSKDPDELALRILLLGFYSKRRFLLDQARAARQKHILWIIENSPTSEIAASPETDLSPDEDGNVYSRAKQLWLRQSAANPEDTRILGKAADFLLLHDPQISEELFKRAQALEPTNPTWSERLAFLYSLGQRYRSRESRAEEAARSLMELENALTNIADPHRRFNLLSKLARAAFEAGEFEKARAYVSELLTKVAEPEFSWNAARAVHHGNLILGRLALKCGDREGAKTHLMEAAKTSGSPALGSFGPNMMLAMELLQLGERQVVVDYLNLCANFWQTDNHQAEQWIYAIERGGVPDFGPNLDY